MNTLYIKTRPLLHYSVLFLATTTLPCTVYSASSLEPVIITASRIDQETRTLPSNTTIITADDIKKSTARTIQELLSQQAGIRARHLYGNNAARASIDIRGFGATATSNTLILLDGRRLNDIDLSAVDLSAIPLHNIERIEIIRGGGSVLYGDGAVGGTINIITKRHGKSGTRGQVAIAGGSFNSREINAGIDYISGDFSVNLAAQSLASDGYRIHNNYRQNNFQADLRQMMEKGEIFLKLGVDEQDLQLPGVRTVDPNIPLDQLNNDRRGSSSLNDYADRSGYFFTLGTTRYLNDDTELVVDLGYRYKNDTAFLSGAFFSSNVDTELSNWSLTPRIKMQNNWLGVPGTLTTGLDFYDSLYKSNRAQTPNTTNQPIHLLKLTQTSVALYAQQILKPQKHYRYNIGVRVQNVKTNAIDRFDATAPGASAFDSQAPGGDNSDTEKGMELGVSYDLNAATTIYAGYNRAFRIATVDETFATFPGAFKFLQPQTSSNIEFGVKYATNKLTAQSGVYYMRLKNEIQFNPVTFSNINLDPTRRYGIEVSAQYQLIPDLKLDANVTLMRSQFRGGAFTGNAVPLVPSKTATLSALWNIRPYMLLTTTVNYVGEKRFDNDQSNTFAKIPSYKTVDMKLTGKLHNWRIAAQVKNIFNEKYFEYGVRSTFTAGRYNAYPLPEREFVISLEKQF